MTVPADIRAELDQTPAWWERVYVSLVRSNFPPKPFDPAEHVGHDIVEVHTYASATVRRFCTECPERES